MKSLSTSLLRLLAIFAIGMGTTAQAKLLLIENITLIDGTGAPPVHPASVLLDNERIVAVRRGKIEAPSRTKRIDGTGKFLIPGLMDMHIHLQGRKVITKEGIVDSKADRQSGISALHSYLYSGVTSVYDAGNDPKYIFRLRSDERSGKIIAPRVFAAGGIVTWPGSHGDSAGATLITGWPEAQPLLDKHIALKPDVLKLTYEERGWGARPMIPHLPKDLMEKIIEYVNGHGIRTVAHTSGEKRAREAIFAGVDALAHPVIQGPSSEAFGKLMGAKKIPMITTLTIGENYSRLVEHSEYLDQPLYRAVLPAKKIAQLKTTTLEEYRGNTWTWWMKIMTPIAQQNVLQVHTAGGVVVLGTDQTIGPAVHREMELIVAAGIKPLDALRIATLNGAIFLGKEAELGSIEESKLADMVLLDANPLEDIHNLKKIHLVIKNGKIIDRSKLKLPVNQ